MRQLHDNRSRALVWAALVLIAASAGGCGDGSASASAPVSVTPGGSVAPTASLTVAPTSVPSAAPSSTPTPVLTYAPPGKFVPTGSMTTGRDSATATLLLDGRVLVAGGSGYDVTHSAELYDPKTGTFSGTGSMQAGREVATAALLKDGRVLIVGGWEWTSATDRVESASADLYDPKTGTFTRTGSLPAARHFQTETLLKDGRVLIAGGETPADGSGTATAELYDPKTGAFSPTGSMTKGRIFHTATLLSDGRVLMAGGNGDNSTEIYDPATGTFHATGSMSFSQPGQGVATLLKDGRVLVVTGQEAELYDASTGKFSPTGAMLRYCLCSGSIGSPVTAPLLNDGSVLVPDEYFDASAKEVNSAELYDPATGTFSQVGPMNGPHIGFTDTLLADGRVLFAGDEGPICMMACPSLSPSAAAAAAADRSAAELYVP